MPNFVSFAAFGAELAHGEKSHTCSLNHPAYLMPWEPKLTPPWNYCYLLTYLHTYILRLIETDSVKHCFVDSHWEVTILCQLVDISADDLCDTTTFVARTPR